MDPPPLTRRTRFVCVSDTHNTSPLDGSFKLPKGDVLIHAGDLTNQGTLSELQRTVDWIERADFEAKIVVAGNHDITLDEEFYSQHGLHFHNQNPQVPADCLRLLQSSPSITHLNHESVVMLLTKQSGPQTTFKVFGSPFSPAQGLWAFGYPPESNVWDQIPLDTDVVVTHTPPKYHCDESKDRGAAGCEVLRQTLWRVRPRLAICGHVHDGRGCERILWDLAMPNVKYKEKDSTYWIDSSFGSKKQALVDLSSRGGEPLKNNGGDDVAGPVGSPAEIPVHKTAFISSFRSKYTDPTVPRSHYSKPTSPAESLDSSVQSSFSPYETCSLDLGRPDLPESNKNYNAPSTMRTQGGPLLSGRSDLEALSHRMGRKETCIINAAIMASKWSPKGGGRKQYNKPIVVDIDLPISVGGRP